LAIDKTETTKQKLRAVPKYTAMDHQLDTVVATGRLGTGLHAYLNTRAELWILTLLNDLAGHATCPPFTQYLSNLTGPELIFSLTFHDLARRSALL
jgi:hypothetical protein